ncbi:MAG: hypothetical protein GXY33_21955 [Phycisphaerae bacterium]|nr:hypothetical protein [Phycisphaerae bacterium]
MKLMKMCSLVAVLALAVVSSGCLDGIFPPTDGEKKPVGLVMLIEQTDAEGLLNWAYELRQRNTTGLLKIQGALLEGYDEELKCLADMGFEFAGGHQGDPFWDVDYETQFNAMKNAKEVIEAATGKPMRVFGSRYFAYDENTLKAAEALGIEFILARGSSDVEALIYKPDEYDVKIISVSNVTFEDMGRGSLCDYSLWARGATAAEFGEILEDAITERTPTRVMVVSHAYLGGAKQAWWEAYQAFLDSGTVTWASSLDEWASSSSGVNIRVPMNLIPINREVTYEVPTPAVPMDQEEDIDPMQSPCSGS